MLAEIVFVVTAYCEGTVTRFGERFPAQGRTCAVDPRVVKPYTALAIEGFGVCYAEDTGGAIKGHRLDVYMDSCKAARAFGVRKLRVLVGLPRSVH